MVEEFDDPLSQLRRLEEHVKEGDRAGLLARWASGRFLLTLRDRNGRLPRGILGAWAEALGFHRSELSARMRFAEKYPTESEVSDVIRQFTSWSSITHEALKHIAQEPDTSPSADDQDPDEGARAETAEPRRRQSYTPRLRRTLEYLEGIESADLTEEDLLLLSGIAQLVERHRQAAIELADDVACDRDKVAA